MDHGTKEFNKIKKVFGTDVKFKEKQVDKCYYSLEKKLEILFNKNSLLDTLTQTNMGGKVLLLNSQNILRTHPNK